ncbi:hypothetical protein PoB_005755600 [Plakobranchus ocellatus]|uniref:Small EDRK-rich factor-like N-terminal domain-containing protein n=1 Tax=Plakobranchus ocellatus TaxID=259542 RepID=A0AAV4CHX4_9GAST|nr:hypothetical protein PoB_005755600 [Plakobranchus ocellatus]
MGQGRKKKTAGAGEWQQNKDKEQQQNKDKKTSRTKMEAAARQGSIERQQDKDQKNNSKAENNINSKMRNR